MIKKIILLFLFSVQFCFSQEAVFLSPLPELSFGMKANEIKKIAIDISNPNALDETKYKIDEVHYFRNKKIDSIHLSFYNNRLFQINMYFPNENWDEHARYFSQNFGPIWNTSDSTSEEKHCMWGQARNSIAMYQLGESLTISYSDDNQKEFQFMDLFTSSIVYIILILFGLFFVMWLFAKLFTSYCPSCKSFSMKYVSGGRGEGRYYNPEFLRTDTRIFYDSNYTYKCKKCKHVRHDHYSGFWVWFRSRHES
jgi:hypothetical protein